eukprot:ctg_3607.g605
MLFGKDVRFVHFVSGDSGGHATHLTAARCTGAEATPRPEGRESARVLKILSRRTTQKVSHVAAADRHTESTAEAQRRQRHERATPGRRENRGKPEEVAVIKWGFRGRYLER